MDVSQFPKMRSYPFRICRPVSWGEMDAYGHVNNTVYFRYFEDVRIAFLERLVGIDDLSAHEIAIVVARTSCKFKLPVTYPDHLVVAARIDDVDDSRFTMSYLVGSKKHTKIAAQGDAMMVAVASSTGKPVDIPENIRQALLGQGL